MNTVTAGNAPAIKLSWQSPCSWVPGPTSRSSRN